MEMSEWRITSKKSMLDNTSDISDRCIEIVEESFNYSLYDVIRWGQLNENPDIWVLR